jgi:hypothetical protein
MIVNRCGGSRNRGMSQYCARSWLQAMVSVRLDSRGFSEESCEEFH